MLLAVLPSIALIFNQRSLEILSGFLAGQPYVFADVVPAILGLGILLTLVGLSARVNNDLIYMMMFDSYYFGMEEVLTDAIQRIQLEDLLKKEINDEYNYIVWRVGSLTDLASGLCDILNKTVSILSLLVVAFSASKLVFFISIVYVVFVFFLNFKVTEQGPVQHRAQPQRVPDHQLLRKPVRQCGSRQGNPPFSAAPTRSSPSGGSITARCSRPSASAAPPGS